MNNHAIGLSGSNIHIEGNADIQTLLTAGCIGITSEDVDSDIRNLAQGVSSYGGMSFNGDQTKIATKAISGDIVINTSNSGANSKGDAYVNVGNTTKGLIGDDVDSDIDIQGNADIQTLSTTGGTDITSAAEGVSFWNDITNTIEGVSSLGRMSFNGDQTKIATKAISGDIVINTSNSGANSKGDAYVNVENTTTGLLGGGIDIEGNADIETLSTTGSVAITSAAKQTQATWGYGAYSSINHETYGVSALGSLNFKGGQTNIASNALVGGITISANNSTQLNRVLAAITSYTSGLSGSAADVHFQGNTDIVASNRSGNIVIEAPLASGSLENVEMRLYATGVEKVGATFDQSVDITAQAQAGNISINAPNLTINSDPPLLAQAEGLLADSPSHTSTVTGDTKILATATSGVLDMNGTISNGSAYAYGVHANNDTSVDLLGNVNITAIANAHQDSSVAADEEKAYALFAENLGVININQAGGKNVQLIGDLVTEGNSLINVKMNTDTSYLRGLVNNQSGEIKLSLANGATWQQFAISFTSRWHC